MFIASRKMCFGWEENSLRFFSPKSYKMKWTHVLEKYVGTDIFCSSWNCPKLLEVYVGFTLPINVNAFSCMPCVAKAHVEVCCGNMCLQDGVVLNILANADTDSALNPRYSS